MAHITSPSVSSDEILDALDEDVLQARRAFRDPFTEAMLDEFLMRLKLAQHRISVLLDRWDD